MVESTTQHFGWTKPEITKSNSTWGGFLNSDLDSIDALIFSNQQGLVPIGTISMFAGATPPANWLLCNGQSLDKTTLVSGVSVYAALFAIIGYTYGGSGNNFNLPNLVQRFPYGAATPGATGGAATVTLDTTMIPAHTHTFAGTAHGHTASETPHTHTVVQTPHGHGVTDPTHAHGGVFVTGAGSWYFTTPSLQSVAFGQTAAAATGISIQVNNANVSLAAASTGVTVAAATATGTNANTGGGLPHPNMPPYISIPFIIRFQ